MTTIDMLGKIMGSAGRVKLMRLFLFHPGHGFSRDSLIKKTKVLPASLRTELSVLEKSDFIQKRETLLALPSKKKNATPKKKKVSLYFLNTEFPLIEPLRTLLLESELVALSDLSSRLKPIGKIKLLVASGIFMQDLTQAIDLLIVGDKLDRTALQKQMALLESEIGKELQYATFTTEEFMYRIKMYDKLIRDIFDYPHQKLINQLELGQL
jgi:hypothetical protein